MIWTDKDGFLETIKNKKRYGIFLDMGVGKTALLLALSDYKMKHYGVKKILIITPKKVSLSTWQNEIAKWDNFNHMSEFVTLIDGSEKERNEKISKKQEYSIHIISSALTRWLVGKRVDIGKKAVIEYNRFTPQYDMIIVDECSQFKDARSHRFKALKRLAVKDLFLLSGTPFSNIQKIGNEYKKADELYYIFNLLYLFTGSLTSFRDRYCYTNSWDEYTYRMNEETFGVLTDILNDNSIRKKLDIPIKMIEQKVYCKIDEVILKKLTRDYFVETNGYSNITASNKAIMINKALQLSNGFMYNEDRETVRINQKKFNTLLEIIEKTQDNIIIFYNFEEDREFLLKNLKGSRLLKEDKDKQDWNAGKIKYLILSPFSEKYGLNLQEGGHTIIWFGLVWSAESYSQANARLYRRGQEKDVNIYYLLSESGYDDYVYDKLVSKVSVIEDFIEYIK